MDSGVSAVRDADGLSAAETVELIGASCITARRYVQYLADTRGWQIGPRFGGTGRPEPE